MAKIRFTAESRVSDEVLARNRETNRRLGLPKIGDSSPAVPELAVVGGGPSVARFVGDLKSWNGDIWAVNGAFQWCRGQGLDAIFYTIDPMIGPEACEGAERAVMADCVDPSLFKALSDVEIAWTGEDAVLHASTGAATAPMLAARKGYRNVTFFGCESSYEELTHIYGNVLGSHVWVDCGGREFKTNPQLIMQAEFLAEMIRSLPDFLHIRGDGFLPALVERGDYDVTHTTPDIHESLAENSAMEAKEQVA